jgi:hypothetical protein
VHKDYASQLQNVLTSVKGINKTDVLTLGTNFGVSAKAFRVAKRFADCIVRSVVVQEYGTCDTGTVGALSGIGRGESSTAV